jgi:hypothetical protein
MRKPIEKMNAGELADEFNPANAESSVRYDYATMYRLTSRLRELHDLTRWVPVSERMPENLEIVLCMTHHGTYVATSYCRHTDQDETWFASRFAAWQRITPPEDK